MENELLLLGLLRRQDMHGYQLTELIERNLSTCTDLKKSSAYFLLDKMAGDGWIRYEEVREGKRPIRRVYSMTQKGEQEFQRLVRENLAEYQPAVFGGDIGLAFVNAVPPQEACRLLTARKQEIEKARSNILNAPHREGPLGWVVEHQERHLTAEMDWVDTLLARLCETNPMPLSESDPTQEEKI